MGEPVRAAASIAFTPACDASEHALLGVLDRGSLLTSGLCSTKCRKVGVGVLADPDLAALEEAFGVVGCKACRNLAYGEAPMLPTVPSRKGDELEKRFLCTQLSPCACD